MDKKQALEILFASSQYYEKELKNKNLLFIFTEGKNTSYIETMFLDNNYLHLTGIKKLDSEFRTPSAFYSACLEKRLSFSSFDFDANGTTEMKLIILKELMNIHKSAKMIGEYNGFKRLLVTDKIAGNIQACMGFIQNGKYYYPNTSLKEDIRDVVERPAYKILAIYRKDVKEDKYSELTFVGKGIDINKLVLPHEISEKILIIKPDDIAETLKQQTAPQVHQKKLNIFEDLERIRQEQEAARKKEPKPPNILPAKPKR